MFAFGTNYLILKDKLRGKKLTSFKAIIFLTLPEYFEDNF